MRNRCLAWQWHLRFTSNATGRMQRVVGIVQLYLRLAPVGCSEQDNDKNHPGWFWKE